MGVLSRPAEAAITTTGHAILGLLALRPAWSTWNLTTQLRRNMRFFWPRAESRIFAEARRLEVRGLAQTTLSYVGRRARTTYSITSTGRDELRTWLATPPHPTSLECESLLRVMLADFGAPGQVFVALDRVRADAHAILDVGRIVGPEYLRGDSPFQDQVHVRAHVLDFLTHHALMLLEWADRTEVLVRQWPTTSDSNRELAALTVIETCLAKYPEPHLNLEASAPGARTPGEVEPSE